MGGGSAFGFVGLVYICSHWFPESKRGILIGLGSSIGTLGAVMGEGPLSQLIQAFGWRIANFQLGLLGLLLALVLFFVVRNDPPEMRRYDQK
jgi:nitrate/nitrite transporter NarK